MKRITSAEKKHKQEAKNREKIVQNAHKHGNKSETSRKYFVSLSSVKRWCNRYDGTWQSLLEGSHRPHSHPRQHTNAEVRQIRKAYKKRYERYGWEGVYSELLERGKYHRSFEGMYHAARRIGLGVDTANQPHAHPRSPSGVAGVSDGRGVAAAVVAGLAD